MKSVIKREDVLSALLYALSNGIDKWYPDIKTFSEVVPDKLPDKCFLLGFAGEVHIEHDFDKRYKASGSFDITYISNTEIGLEEENNQVFSVLSLGMRVIEFPDVLKLRLGSHKKRVADTVLHDICKFTTFLYEVDNIPLIARIEYDEEVL